MGAITGGELVDVEEVVIPVVVGSDVKGAEMIVGLFFLSGSKSTTSGVRSITTFTSCFLFFLSFLCSFESVGVDGEFEMADKRARLGGRTCPVTKSICSLALATFLPSTLLVDRLVI